MISANTNGGSVRGVCPPQKLEDFAILKVLLCSLVHTFLIKLRENLPNIFQKYYPHDAHLDVCLQPSGAPNIMNFTKHAKRMVKNV